jgi:hypothetical protein
MKPKQFFILLLALTLAACTPEFIPAPTMTPFPTATSAPTFTFATTPTSSLTPASLTLLITSTPTLLPVSAPPIGLHMAYIMGGNLYFQDGSNPAMQLTNSGEDWLPIFSDDGEKIVFMRGKEIHSINTDGSQEQVLVTNEILRAIDSSYSVSTGFLGLTAVSSTHLLLFSTQDFDGTLWHGDLFVVDTDTAEIKRLLLPEQGGDFYVSPDGKSIAIDTTEQIDVIDIRGETIYRNLLTYISSEPIFLSPGIHWMPDLTGLVVILPVPTYYESNEPPDYTVWHYALDGTPGKQVSLDPLPRGHYMAKVSPDGNWIIYNNYKQSAFYVGDLRTGHTELYESQLYVDYYDWSWSPDSKHFIYKAAGKLYLGSMTESPVVIGSGGFLGWVDSNHYLYYEDKTIVYGEIGGGQKIIFTGANQFFQNRSTFTFIFPETRIR